MSSKINVFIYANNVSTYEKPRFSNNTNQGYKLIIYLNKSYALCFFVITKNKATLPKTINPIKIRATSKSPVSGLFSGFGVVTSGVGVVISGLGISVPQKS